jgi:hypothetical protein
LAALPARYESLPLSVGFELPAFSATCYTSVLRPGSFLLSTVKLAILIAIEKYAQSTIDGVSFASNHVSQLSEVLQQHGFDPAESVILVNENATKTAIESRVRRAIKSCLDEDILFVYYAGQSFSKNSINRLTCVDTDVHDIDHTTIPLDWLHSQFRESDCSRIVFFFDSGEKPFGTRVQNHEFESIRDSDLIQFYDENPKCVCFAACKPDEVAYASRKIKSGIWLNHLVEALDGRALSALTNGSILTSRSLQNHLVRSVAQSLTTTYSSKKSQSPSLYCKTDLDMVVADLSEIFVKRKSSLNPYAGLIQNVSFWASRTTSVKSLSGFKKGHAIPDRSNLSSQTFVASLAQQQVSEDLDLIFQQLKSAFKFKRADIRVTDQGDGTGSIITPYFNYSISVAIDDQNPAYVIWRRSVDSIKDSDQIFSDQFASVFQSVFDTVEFSIPAPVDLDAMIDSVEGLDDDRIAIEYDHDATHCNLTIEGVRGEIQVTKHSLLIVHPMPEAPSILLRSFLAIQTALLGPDGVSLVPIDQK